MNFVLAIVEGANVWPECQLCALTCEPLLPHQLRLRFCLS